MNSPMDAARRCALQVTRHRVAGSVVRFVAIGVLAAALPAAAAARKPAAEPVTVFAAASLAEPFQAMAAELRRAGWEVRFNFAGTQQLAAQIEHGARADVFAAADARWMRPLAEHGAIAGAPAEFARNHLCVIVPRGNPGQIDALEHLARRGVKLVIGADAVPVGRYARDALRRLSKAPGFPAEFERLALANVVSEEENVKAIVAKVQLGEADAGIVYRSDVNPVIARRVRVLEIPAAHNVVARYPIAVLRGAPNADGARAFVEFVRSPAGQRTLAAHGLRPAGRPAR